MNRVRVSIRGICIVSALLTSICAYPSISSDSVPDSAATTSKPSFFKRIISYFDESNKPKKHKKFDVSFIGGPHFSSDTQLGVGLVAAGNYYMKGDTLSLPSNVSLYGDISTVGFYMLGIKGTNIFPQEKQRLEYNVYFYSFPTKFWGIGYDMGKSGRNETKFNQFCVKISADWFFKFGRGLYLGPGAEFNFIRGTKVDRPELWNGEPLTTRTIGAGFTLRYDTRDSYTEPHTGWFLSLTQRFAPRFLGNKMAFSFTQFKGSHYNRLWKGGILAAGVSAKFNYGNVPWSMLSTFGGSSMMRGYYEGRYRDKIGIDAVVELRQHVWRRNGVVLWTGVATVAPEIDAIRWKKVLPCFGAGYRWEFKKRCNVRLDFGVGRGESSFIFNINEAF